MHAASVDPEPGSNSPKELHSLAAATSSEGLTTRTSVFVPDLCHSSVVKVQPAPRHVNVLGAERSVWGLRPAASNACRRFPRGGAGLRRRQAELYQTSPPPDVRRTTQGR